MMFFSELLLAPNNTHVSFSYLDAVSSSIFLLTFSRDNRAHTLDLSVDFRLYCGSPGGLIVVLPPELLGTFIADMFMHFHLRLLLL